MASLPYPGNVRELENLIEYGVIFEKGDFLMEDTLLKKIGKKESSSLKGGLKDMVAQFERKIIQELISHYGSDTENKLKIAEKLQISQATLYRKLRELNI